VNRPRDRVSTAGLLPRMEARVGKKATTFRYHPVGGRPINLGKDKQLAIRRVLDLNNEGVNTVNELWRIYQDSTEWAALADDTRAGYAQCSGPLLKIFGPMAPAHIKPTHIARYLRIERKTAPIRANREVALLSNLLNLAVERGQIEANPCKQVRRNKERPRKKAPLPDTLKKFLDWAWARCGQSRILAGMAEFTSVGGNRGIEFRRLTWPQIDAREIRLIRAKQRDGSQVVEVIDMGDLLVDLMERMRALARDDRHGWVFPNARGNAYTAQAFKCGWNRLKIAARKAGALDADKNFTFHDLRSFFVTQYKKKHGHLPDMHANPATTARVYDSSTEVGRASL